MAGLNSNHFLYAFRLFEEIIYFEFSNHKKFANLKRHTNPISSSNLGLSLFLYKHCCNRKCVLTTNAFDKARSSKESIWLNFASYHKHSSYFFELLLNVHNSDPRLKLDH